MNGAWVVRFVGAAGVGLLLASCSFMYVQGPPAGHAVMDDFPCETSFGLPLVDLSVGAGLLIWGITAGETTSDNFGQPVESSATDNLVTGLVLGVPFMVGAGWGAREVMSCRSAKAALAKRTNDAAARVGGARIPTVSISLVRPSLSLTRNYPINSSLGYGISSGRDWPSEAERVNTLWDMRLRTPARSGSP